MFRCPAEIDPTILKNAESFLNSYLESSMQSYGHWVYAIWAGVSRHLQPLVPNKRFEDFIALNAELNQFFLQNKTKLTEKLAFAANDKVANKASLRKFLFELGFLTFLEKLKVVTQQSDEEIFDSILAYLQREMNYASYALWAELQLIDVACSFDSLSDHSRMDKIGGLPIYAAKGPKPHIDSDNLQELDWQNKFNGNFFRNLAIANISHIVALGNPGKDFFDYGNPEKTYFWQTIEDGCQHNHNIIITLEPVIINDYQPNPNRHYHTYSINIKYECTDSSGQPIQAGNKQLAIHNIKVDDGMPFNLNDDEAKIIFTALAAAFNANNNALVHCRAGLGRTGQFLLFFMLYFSNKFSEIFANNNAAENLKKYRNLIVALRESRPRLVASAEQTWMPIAQALRYFDWIRATTTPASEQSSSPATVTTAAIDHRTPPSDIALTPAEVAPPAQTSYENKPSLLGWIGSFFSSAPNAEALRTASGKAPTFSG